VKVANPTDETRSAVLIRIAVNLSQEPLDAWKQRRISFRDAQMREDDEDGVLGVNVSSFKPEAF